MPLLLLLLRWQVGTKETVFGASCAASFAKHVLGAGHLGNAQVLHGIPSMDSTHVYNQVLPSGNTWTHYQTQVLFPAATSMLFSATKIQVKAYGLVSPDKRFVLQDTLTADH